MDQNPTNSAIKADRKTIEKNRRDQMKVHYSQLWSLVPNHSSREVVPVHDQLDGATRYISSLEDKLEKMRKKKKWLMMGGSSGIGVVEDKLPVAGRVEVAAVDSGVEVTMTTGVESHQLVFRECVRTVHEEGAQVVTAAYSVAGNVVCHTIHSQINIGESREDVEGAIARIADKLKKIVYDMNI